MFVERFKVESPNVTYGDQEIHSIYNYETTELVHESRNGSYAWIVKPKTVLYEFKTDTRVPKLGVMLVGWGGNNGSTLTAAVIANREGISWATKDNVQQANYFGSLTQASTIRVGSFNGEEIYAPFKSLLPMLHTVNHLAKSLALLKQVPDIIKHTNILKPRFDAINNLIRVMLDVTKCIIEFTELPSEYISPESPEMGMAVTHIPTTVYWVVRGIVACISQTITLIGIDHEYISSTTEAWELSTIAHKLANIHGHLTKQLELCPKHIEEKMHHEAYQALVRLFDTVHIDNMKILRALFYSKDDLPVFEGFTKKRVSLDVLRRKFVMLFISDFDIRHEELFVLVQIYNDTYHGKAERRSHSHMQNLSYPLTSVCICLVNPDEIVFGGWDISNLNLADSMTRAKVLDIDLQKQLRPYMESMVPLPGIYDPDFIAANQDSRANNVIKGTKSEQVQQIIKDIREFKENNKVDKVVVLWTANTERFSNVMVGLNDTTENLFASLEKNEAEIAPSTLYAIACVMENIPFINGSPQNTFVPGLIDLAIRRNSLIGGDDFKSGQTKMKSVLVDFLVGAGIKPTSIVSYNHLGNNDGMNLSAPQTFRSKEISKSNVVDDMVASNGILYQPGEHPDHVIVIKYVPYVGDSKRAMDEYTSEIFMGGKNTIVLHNTCEDSLLAAPIILDLVLLAELSTRIQLKAEGEVRERSLDFVQMFPVPLPCWKVPFLPSCGNNPELPDESPSCSAGHAGCECPLQTEGYAGEHTEGLHWPSPREQYDPRVQVTF
ncbi:hypothetical protein IEQ34_018160 [Dendrobium chrysotoxum]|uniref:inositol-3-phosphate synthase n=1 Tax=Dendrobium chrysotoxum TaxID=161865 RepID=A0AAV7GBL8_DENCH|nr:hypothetical protein IEQ34_018160 [Dendrobium chrysotoxum]